MLFRFIARKYLTDIAPERNLNLTLIPQVLANSAADLLTAAETVRAMGYTELNWNLGCPFPMVTKRLLGAGLLPYPDTIDHILTDFEVNTDISLSIKMRLGLEFEEEVWQVIDVLNRHRIKEVIVHPRIGRQMYTGPTNQTIIGLIAKKLTLPMAYNGDIITPEQTAALLASNPQINHIMIGRGLLQNPFLALQIKGAISSAQPPRNQLLEFVGSISEQQLGRLQGAGHFIAKMTSYWEYWSQLFADQHKALKLIKKCRTIADYSVRMQEIIMNWDFTN